MCLLLVFIITILTIHCCAQNNYLNISEDPYYLDDIESLRQDYENNREALIHRLCTHRSRFTEKELETARIYLQTRYMNGAKIKPKNAPCESLRVMRDFKCLSHDEKLAFTDAYKKLYENSAMDRFAYYHGGYWPFVHLTAENYPFHNKFMNDLQKQIEIINPAVVIPYWDVNLDFFAPHKSIIWDYLGHAGNSSNDYCIPDGTFKNQTVKHPVPHCIRRQWNTDGSIPAWESPELMTAALQITRDDDSPNGDYWAEHFKKHLHIGGYNGDMSITYAPNDPVFLLFHLYNLCLHLFKWFLASDAHLLPTKIGTNGRHDPQYEYDGKWVDVNFETDTILGFNETAYAEAWHFGFGNFCYIPDQIIESINNLFAEVKPKLPATVDRLRNALPSDEFARLFPAFASKTYTDLSSLLPDVGGNGSNNQTTCKPIPLPLNYTSNENGKRQFEAFNQLGKDGRNGTLISEELIIDVINTLNKYKYCSPYIA